MEHLELTVRIAAACLSCFPFLHAVPLPSCSCICSPSTVLEPPSIASLLCRVVACRFPPTYTLLVSKEGRLDGSFMCALELGCKETLPSLRTGLSRDTTFSTHFLQIPAAAVLMFLVLCDIFFLQFCAADADALLNLGHAFRHSMWHLQCFNAAWVWGPAIVYQAELQGYGLPWPRKRWIHLWRSKGLRSLFLASGSHHEREWTTETCREGHYLYIFCTVHCTEWHRQDKTWPLFLRFSIMMHGHLWAEGGSSYTSIDPKQVGGSAPSVFFVRYAEDTIPCFWRRFWKIKAWTSS